ncbi:MAG TPA: HRDC domain-containing protein [Flavobacteriales bacterium]|nr:HRDC domain-containing protein [Flavobacteriales bacterium]
MPAYELITDPETLTRVVRDLEGAPLLALDTEASSFHRYQERVCLVQLSDRRRNLLIDPLAITDLGPLGALLADPGMQVVIHDADYDLRILAKYHGIRVENVFDTLVAAELLNEPEIGLAALLLKYQGVQVDKKFQKADWSERPLPTPMLDYAAGDTAHLIALRDQLEARLREKDRWTWAEEEFALLTDAPFNLPVDEEPTFLKVKGAKVLKPHQLAVLREVHGWREGLAKKLDRAPFMVLGNEVLIGLATEPPSSVHELAARKGVNERLVQRHGRDIMEAVQRGVALPREEWPRLPKAKRWERDDDFEDRVKRLKAVRDKLTAEHDLRPGIVAANQLLMDIARTLPGDLDALAVLPGIRRYQVEHFGSALLNAL